MPYDEAENRVHKTTSGDVFVACKAKLRTGECVVNKSRGRNIYGERQAVAEAGKKMAELYAKGMASC